MKNNNEQSEFDDLKTIHILLIDDNPADVDLAIEALNESGINYQIHPVSDGLSALQFLRKEKRYIDAPTPNLIFLDLRLPKMDGIEMLREIKQNKLICQIPVIILSTSPYQEDIIKAYKNHANCYIMKPNSISRFIDIFKAIKIFWIDTVELPENDL